MADDGTVTRHHRRERTPLYVRLLARNREFRGLVLAQVTSEVGDHFARFALAALVLDRSDSVFYAALAFVVGYIPGLFGGVLLSPFADRLPRKHVLVVCDLARAVTVGVLALVAVGGTPLWVLFALLLFAELFSQPFLAARSAMLPDIVPGQQEFMAGAALGRGLHQANQVLGLAAAGAVVAASSPRTALAVDALTFVASYLFIQVMVRFRAAPVSGRGGVRGFVADTAEGLRLMFSDPARLTFGLLVWGTIGFLVVPEAVALAYTREHHAADLGGVLMASVPAGGVFGVVVISGFRPVRAAALAPWLAALAFVPLVLTFMNPAPWLAGVLWFVSGALQAFLVALFVGVMLLTPPEGRGRVAGVGAAGLSLCTAMGYAFGGRLADVATPSAAVGIAGVAGLAVVALISVRWSAAIAELTTRSAKLPSIPVAEPATPHFG